jgi:hypothetical protein
VIANLFQRQGWDFVQFGRKAETAGDQITGFRLGPGDFAYDGDRPQRLTAGIAGRRRVDEDAIATRHAGQRRPLAVVGHHEPAGHAASGVLAGDDDNPVPSGSGGHAPKIVGLADHAAPTITPGALKAWRSRIAKGDQRNRMCWAPVHARRMRPPRTVSVFGLSVSPAELAMCSATSGIVR